MMLFDKLWRYGDARANKLSVNSNIELIKVSILCNIEFLISMMLLLLECFLKLPVYKNKDVDVRIIFFAKVESKKPYQISD